MEGGSSRRSNVPFTSRVEVDAGAVHKRVWGRKGHHGTFAPVGGRFSSRQGKARAGVDAKWNNRLPTGRPEQWEKLVILYDCSSLRFFIENCCCTWFDPLCEPDVQLDMPYHTGAS
jgi:hypothetical protein